MRRSSAIIVSTLVRIIPYACLFAAIATFLFLFLLGRSDLAFKSLYLLVPIAIASSIIIVKPGWFTNESFGSSPRISLSLPSFQNLVLLFVLLFIISLCLLIGNNVRPLSYFVLVGVITSLIFIEILSCGDGHAGRKGIILLQIVSVSANLIFGQTLRLPLFFGYGDVLAHMYNINTIVETGRVTSAMLVDYQFFPALHIFGAIGKILSGLDLQTSYFLFNGLVFLISIPIVYLLVSKVTRNVHLPLVSALIYSLSREVIFNGMYMITRVMAFVLCLMILYLLIRGRTDLKLRSLTVFLVFPLVLTHHTTLLHFSGILFILLAIEFFLYRPRWYIGFNFAVFFTLAYLGYWVWLSYPFFQNTLIDYFSATGITQMVLPDVEKSLFFTYTNNADAILIAFMAMFGIISLLRQKRELVTPGTAFVLFSMIALTIYFPTIANFLSRAFLSARLELLVTPFIAFITAGGLLLITGKSSTLQPHHKLIVRTGISLFVVFFLSLSSTVIVANFTDLNLNKVLGNANRQYFTESEMVAFSFAHEYGRDYLYFGDYESSVYMRARLGLPVRQTIDVFNPSSISSGCMLFRKQELESRGRLGFNIWGQEGTADQTYSYRPSESLDLQASWEKENKIFDSGTLYIYMKKTPK